MDNDNEKNKIERERIKRVLCPDDHQYKLLFGTEEERQEEIHKGVKDIQSALLFVLPFKAGLILEPTLNLINSYNTDTSNTDTPETNAIQYNAQYIPNNILNRFIPIKQPNNKTNNSPVSIAKTARTTLGKIERIEEYLMPKNKQDNGFKNAEEELASSIASFLGGNSSLNDLLNAALLLSTIPTKGKAKNKGKPVSIKSKKNAPKSTKSANIKKSKRVKNKSPKSTHVKNSKKYNSSSKTKQTRAKNRKLDYYRKKAVELGPKKRKGLSVNEAAKKLMADDRALKREASKKAIEKAGTHIQIVVEKQKAKPKIKISNSAYLKEAKQRYFESLWKKKTPIRNALKLTFKSIGSFFSLIKTKTLGKLASVHWRHFFPKLARRTWWKLLDRNFKLSLIKLRPYVTKEQWKQIGKNILNSFRHGLSAIWNAPKQLGRYIQSVAKLLGRKTYWRLIGRKFGRGLKKAAIAAGKKLISPITKTATKIVDIYRAIRHGISTAWSVLSKIRTFKDIFNLGRRIGSISAKSILNFSKSILTKAPAAIKANGYFTIVFDILESIYNLTLNDSYLQTETPLNEAEKRMRASWEAEENKSNEVKKRYLKKSYVRFNTPYRKSTQTAKIVFATLMAIIPGGAMAYGATKGTYDIADLTDTAAQLTASAFGAENNAFSRLTSKTMSSINSGIDWMLNTLHYYDVMQEKSNKALKNALRTYNNVFNKETPKPSNARLAMFQGETYLSAHGNAFAFKEMYGNVIYSHLFDLNWIVDMYAQMLESDRVTLHNEIFENVDTTTGTEEEISHRKWSLAHRCVMQWIEYYNLMIGDVKNRVTVANKWYEIYYPTRAPYTFSIKGSTYGDDFDDWIYPLYQKRYGDLLKQYAKKEEDEELIVNEEEQAEKDRIEQEEQEKNRVSVTEEDLSNPLEELLDSLGENIINSEKANDPDAEIYLDETSHLPVKIKTDELGWQTGYYFDYDENDWVKFDIQKTTDSFAYADLVEEYDNIIFNEEKYSEMLLLSAKKRKILVDKLEEKLKMFDYEP